MELLICKRRPIVSDICNIFTTNICLLECWRPLGQGLAPAQSIFADRVERALTRETVEASLVLGGSLQRIIFIETHKRLAPLPRPLAPTTKSCSTLKKPWKPVDGQGQVLQLLPGSPGASLLPQLLLGLHSLHHLVNFTHTVNGFTETLKVSF